MSNAHGYISKVPREELSERDRARLDTWMERAYTDDNLFRTLAHRPEAMDLFFAWVGAVYGPDAGLDRHMLELCRMRMARRNECFH